jgi:replication factor A1
MQVKDLQARQGNVDITLDVVEIGQAREFQKFGKSGKVATATAKDETGDIKLSLWNEQVDSVKSGSKIHVSNGFVTEFQGEKQLTTGKFGKLEILGSSTPKQEETEIFEEKAPEEAVDIEEEEVQ